MIQYLQYLVYIIIALVLPIILVDYPPPEVLRRRYAIAIISGVIAGLFTGFVRPSIASSDAMPAFVLAAAAGTVLYGLGNLLFGINAKSNNR
jgi:hypothetical protein